MRSREQLEQRASVLKAMASAPRLAIVEELSTGPCSVGKLADLTDLDISTVSRHLSQLRNAGIVSSRRMGTSIVYSLRAACVLQFFDCVERVLSLDPRDTDCCTDSEAQQ